MFQKLAGFFGPQKRLEKTVKQINALELGVEKLSDEELRKESEEISRQARNDGLDIVLPKAFALVREAAKRTLGQRHFDVQLMGGIVLHQGNIAEMVTGEGKTLAATAPVYLNALNGQGVHVVTVNEYLAKRDAVWMGQIYNFLGLNVACLVHDGAFIYDPDFTEKNQNTKIKNQNDNLKIKNDLDKERDLLGSFKVEEAYLRPISRKEAYQADITYGTNHEFGFDYLRDNLANNAEAQVQRPFNFAIVDEVDSVLIDEARTPLIISAPDAESSEYYKTFTRIVAGLQKDTDYEVDEKLKAVNITQSGIDKVEKKLGIQELYSSENLRLSHYLQETLKAYGLFHLDKDYVVKNGEVIIVDQFTGRMLPGRRYSAGLHQAIEAKEGVRVQNESRTYAQITIQNYFRLYKKLAGMTGTAQTSAEEFHKVYGLEVVSVPTNKQLIREDLADAIYKNREGKYRALIEEVKKTSEAGRPVLIGTVSITNNEEVSDALSRAGVKHEVLNAKNHEREGAIIAQAGRAGAVTVATNMAGRGVDIILGGNPPNAEAAEKIKLLGGLHVIGTERHEARRIDNQLRGRAGRQGDPGSSNFFLSLDDDILRIFGGERIKKLMERFDMPDDQPISAGLVSKAVEQAQSKIEGSNFDIRKHLLEYDDILNKQRLAIYRKRQDLLVSRIQPPALQVLDMFWMNHLENIEALMESVRLRAYGQHDPLVEFRREAHILYRQLLADFEEFLSSHPELKNIVSLRGKPPVAADRGNLPAGEHEHPAEFHPEQTESLRLSAKASASAEGSDSDRGNLNFEKVGRNDPCPCGAVNPATGQVYKYKKCGLINASHHKKV